MSTHMKFTVFTVLALAALVLPGAIFADSSSGAAMTSSNNAMMNVTSEFVSPEPSTVRAESSGFTLAGMNDHITIAINVGDMDLLQSWELEITNDQGAIVKSYAGTLATLPTTIEWHGLTDSGSLAPAGHYTSVLTVDYFNLYKPETVKGRGFMAYGGATQQVGLLN